MERSHEPPPLSLRRVRVGPPVREVERRAEGEEVSELPYKRRLRERKRKITTTLTLQGYRVRSFDDGPFHLIACRGRVSRAVRIEFGYTDIETIRLIGREPVPAHCQREIWQISAEGRITVVAKIPGGPR